MASPQEYAGDRCYTTVTIANGGTVSGAADLGGTVLVGVILPAALTGVALKLQTSNAIGGTYVAVADGAGADVSKTVAASKSIPLDPVTTRHLQFVKVVSGSAEGAARDIILVSIPRV